jgi:MFS transporter, ACS family, tartrate transporter
MAWEEEAMEARVISKVSRRIVPFVALCYFVCYLDRVNVGFAALQMNSDLGFTATMFGWGAGIFFVGYFFFEVPSNLALERFGARLWIARIMVTWGLLSAAMALIWNEASFLVVRFLLGAAEAGFFPGIILFLTYWFPAEYRARMVGASSSAGAQHLAKGVAHPFAYPRLGRADITARCGLRAARRDWHRRNAGPGDRRASHLGRLFRR